MNMDSLSQLQDEQKKRFARIKMKQAVKPPENGSVTPNDLLLFGVSDDLNLSVGDVSSSASIGLNVTLEAANTAMREELRELKDETGRLRKSLAEREYEIKRLNKKIVRSEEEKRMITDAGLATDSASTKIVELSKKNRDLSSQMESEKSKNIRLQQKINELERKLVHASMQIPDDHSKLSKNTCSPSLSPRESLTTEVVGSLQDQLNASNLRVSEFRNQVQSLKQDMKIALKILSQETGEEQTNIQTFLSNNGQGYRGRAQQVIALQDKVRELEQKLKTDLDLNPKVDKNVMRIKHIERTRKEQCDALKQDFNTLQEQHADVQRKWDASKARNKVLMSEVKTLKSQISVFTEKGAHDNELIETLMKQQDNLQKLLERKSSMKENSKKQLVINSEKPDQRQPEESEIKKLKQLLAERELKVRELEEQVIKTRDSLDADHRPLSVFNSSGKVRSSNSFIDASGNDVTSLPKKCVELKALYDASEIERQQLSRIVTSLTRRNEELIGQHEQMIGNFHDIKRKCAAFEQQLDNIKNSDKAFTARESSRGIQPSELEAQLSIQRDENNALKEALETTLRSKQSDMNMYLEMTQQTKQVFLDALRNITVK